MEASYEKIMEKLTNLIQPYYTINFGPGLSDERKKAHATLVDGILRIVEANKKRNLVELVIGLKNMNTKLQNQKFKDRLIRLVAKCHIKSQLDSCEKLMYTNLSAKLGEVTLLKCKILILAVGGMITQAQFKGLFELEYVRDISEIKDYKILLDQGVVEKMENGFLETCGATNEEALIAAVEYAIGTKLEFDYKRVYNIAARYGCIRVLEYMPTCGYGLIPNITHFATKHNQLQVLKWAQAKGVPWNLFYINLEMPTFRLTDEVKQWLKTESDIKDVLKFK